MSWNFEITGTPAGVKAYVAKQRIDYPSCLPQAVADVIVASVDALVAEYHTPGGQANAVKVSTYGHGGSIGKLEIQNANILLDPNTDECADEEQDDPAAGEPGAK